MKRIVAHEELCIGCGLCEVYCTVEHSKSKEPVKAFRSEYPKPISRIRTVRDGIVSFAIQCRHCSDPPCVLACLTGAMKVDEKTGLVAHDDKRCIGCLTCIVACPLGAIRINPYMRKVVAKCDFCQGLDIPMCVANCANEALTLEEVDPK